MSSTVRTVRGANIWVLLIIAVIILGFIVWQQRDSSPQAADPGPISALGASADEPDPSELNAPLNRLERAWRQGDRNRFIAAAGNTSAARSWGAQAYDNLQRLGVKSIDLSLAPATAAQQPYTRNDGTFTAQVEVSWVPGARSGLPARATDSATVAMHVRADSRLSVEGAAATEDPMPVWLVGALDVTRTGDSVVVRVDGGTNEPRMRTMLQRAMADVRRVYGKPQHDAFIVMPRTVSQSSAIIGGGRSRLNQIAAITTTLDGSNASNGPVAVVLNPEVFTPMNARATQIVLTHETTHEATNAATAVLPLWVAEGYADYVALSRDELSPIRSASQILARVRKDGPPNALPSDDDFSASAGLGATYESAWMAFRMLGETYGDDAVTKFYRQVLGGTSTDVAARRVFDTELAQITRDWRANLEYWAARPR